MEVVMAAPYGDNFDERLRRAEERLQLLVGSYGHLLKHLEGGHVKADDAHQRLAKVEGKINSIIAWTDTLQEGFNHLQDRVAALEKK